MYCICLHEVLGTEESGENGDESFLIFFKLQGTNRHPLNTMKSSIYISQDKTETNGNAEENL